MRGCVKAISARMLRLVVTSVDGFVGLRHISDEFVETTRSIGLCPSSSSRRAHPRVAATREGRCHSRCAAPCRARGVVPPAVTLRLTDCVGMVVTGKVKAVTDFGVFVRLDGSDRLDVLCHTTELSDHKVGNIGRAFAVGTAVKVAIIKVGQLRAARVDAPIHGLALSPLTFRLTLALARSASRPPSRSHLRSAVNEESRKLSARCAARLDELEADDEDEPAGGRPQLVQA